MEDMVYLVSEVAKLLKMDKNKVYVLIDKGVLKALKLGRLKVTRKELERFLEDYNGMDLTDLDNIKPVVAS